MNLELRCKSIARWASNFYNEAEAEEQFEFLKQTKERYPIEMQGYQIPITLAENIFPNEERLEPSLEKLHKRISSKVIVNAWRFNRLCVSYETSSREQHINIDTLRQWIGVPIYIPLRTPSLFKGQKIDGFICGVVPTLFSEIWLVINAITISGNENQSVVFLKDKFLGVTELSCFIDLLIQQNFFTRADSRILEPVLKILFSKNDEISLWIKRQLSLCRSSLNESLSKNMEQLKFYDLNCGADYLEDVIDKDEVQVNYPSLEDFPISRLAFSVDLTNKLETWVRLNNTFIEPKHFIPATQIQWTNLAGPIIRQMVIDRKVPDAEILKAFGLHMYCLGAIRTYDGIPVDVFFKMYSLYRRQEKWLDIYNSDIYKTYITFAQAKLMQYYRQYGKTRNIT